MFSNVTRGVTFEKYSKSENYVKCKKMNTAIGRVACSNSEIQVGAGRFPGCKVQRRCASRGCVEGEGTRTGSVSGGGPF